MRFLAILTGFVALWLAISFGLMAGAMLPGLIIYTSGG